MSNISPALINDLQQIDRFDDLFGSQNFCDCKDCKSMLSPAAYFVDLMSFIREFFWIAGSIQHQNRRKLIIAPDLFSNSFLDVRDHLELMKRRKDKVNFHSNNRNKKVFIIGLVIAAIAISGILAIVLPSVVIHKVNNNNGQAAKSLLIKEISNPTYPLAPALGSSKAKVTMVEFGDYQCHFCADISKRH